MRCRLQLNIPAKLSIITTVGRGNDHVIVSVGCREQLFANECQFKVGLVCQPGTTELLRSLSCKS